MELMRIERHRRRLARRLSFRGASEGSQREAVRHRQRSRDPRPITGKFESIDRSSSYDLYREDAANQELLHRVSELPSLPNSWREYFRKRLWNPDADNSVAFRGVRPWIVSILRTVAGSRKGTGMESD